MNLHVPISNRYNNKVIMKKSLILALSLCGIAIAAPTTENFTFSSTGDSTLTNRYDLSEDWSLSLELAICPGMQDQSNITVDLISLNGTDFTLDWVSEVPVTGSGNIVHFGTSLAVSGVSKKTYMQTSYNTPMNQWGSGTLSPRNSIPYTATLAYSSEKGEITISVVNSRGTTLFNYSVNKFIEEETILTDMSTGITQDVVDYFTADGKKYWSVPTGTFTGTIAQDSVPEPGTATLSLFALAGLAARRRRR